VCEATGPLDVDVDKGDVVECGDCRTQLEVVELDPVALDLVDPGLPPLPEDEGSTDLTAQ